MNCSRNDLVLLPIPFSDLTSAKVRPAIVIGHGATGGDLFLIPITSRLSQGDFPLKEWKKSGWNSSVFPAPYDGQRVPASDPVRWNDRA